MRSVGSHGELQLQQQLVGDAALAISRAAKLAAQDAELAGKVGQQKTAAGIAYQAGGVEGLERGACRRIEGLARGADGCRIGRQARPALRLIEASAQNPAASELVVA